MKHLIRFFTVALILISCSKEKDNDITPSEDFYFLKYDNDTIKTNGSALYLYDKIDNDYYYTFICGNGNIYSSGFDVYDSYSNNDYLKLHFKGDSMMLLNNTYSVIADSNCFMIHGFNDTLKTYNSIDYIKSGYFTVKKRNDIGQPLAVEFNGTTKLGKVITSYNFLSSPNVSYKLERKVKGQYRFQNKDFEISIVEVFILDSNTLNLNIRDFDYSNKTQHGLDLWIYKKDVSKLDGLYIADKSSNNEYFNGMIQNYSYFKKYFNVKSSIFSGILKIDRLSNDNYKVDFQLKTENNDSIIGSCKNVIVLKKI